MNRRSLVLLVLALLALGCAAEPESEIYPSEVTLDATLADTHGEQVLRAFEVWNERFPGCPHAIGMVTDLDPTHHEAGDLAVRETIPGYPDRAAIYWLPSRSINVTYTAADEGLVSVLVHELGHGHGIHGHASTGLMRPTGTPTNDDVTIDDVMAALVCEGDPRCCGG